MREERTIQPKPCAGDCVVLGVAAITSERDYRVAGGEVNECEGDGDDSSDGWDRKTQPPRGIPKTAIHRISSPWLRSPGLGNDDGPVLTSYKTLLPRSAPIR